MALGARYLNPRAHPNRHMRLLCRATKQREWECSRRDRCVAMSHIATAEILGRWVPLCVVVVLATLDFGSAIDCFKCVSLNGNYPACDDPFHNNFTAGILEAPCMGGRKGRNGLFPATACIKLAGVYDDTGDRITVRGCALDSGTLTTDTEIIRMSHCGGFYFDDRYVRGCLQSCDDADACNMTPMLQTSLGLLSLCSISLMAR